MKTIFGRWGSYDEMIKDFKHYDWSDNPTPQVLKEPVPLESEVLFASYGGGSYDGDATVIFRKDVKLYEVHGGHCSCNGLEDQWEPAETSVGALALRGKKTDEDYGYHFLHDHDAESYDAYWKLVEGLQK